MTPPQPIEDYAMIGDRHTTALVGRDGSLDWLCLPRFDSAACFTALLGTPDHGRWLLRPDPERHDPGTVTVERRYVEHSAVLETTFTADTGTLQLRDAMPAGDGRADVVRRVSCTSGQVRLVHEWVVRFSYGKVRPWVSRRTGPTGEEVITAVAGPDMLVLRGDRLPTAEGNRHTDVVDLAAGDTLTLSATWVPSWQPVPSRLDPDTRLDRAGAEESDWAARCPGDVPHRDTVVRSLLTLRLLTHAETGGIVAAPTTSLPEDFGGERNWDYRYCWLRDAALTLVALLDAGFTDEALRWRDWLLRAVAGDPEDLQIMYGVDGGREMPERELDHLPGYAGSRPVRIGNGAARQRQTDVLGEVMHALHRAREAGVAERGRSWPLQMALVQALADHWQETDHGLWEVRGPRRAFTHSRVMVWTAFDRAVRAVEEYDLDGPVQRWRELRAQVRDEVLEHGYDADRGCFTQHYGTREVDAALLMMPLVGFLPGDHPRVVGTIRAVEQDLMRDGLLLRYRTSSGVDGLAGEEHPFLACSGWLVSAYALAGETDNAHALLDRLCALTNDVGLLAEEYDTRGQRMAGNFPQAFSHLTLVRAAFQLREASG